MARTVFADISIDLSNQLITRYSGVFYMAKSLAIS